MKKSSSIDNPFFRLMGAIGDLVVLNILWLVVLAAGIAALAGLRAASAQDDVFTGLLAAVSFLLLAGVCCCRCWPRAGSSTCCCRPCSWRAAPSPPWGWRP